MPDAAVAPPFVTAEWRWLAMLNYEVDPRVLRSRVPRGVELDTWQGRTLASVVGFRFLGTRVAGVAIPLHRDFDEVNLRFYVRRRGPEGWRRGVVFVREIVPRTAIAAVARVLYNENYVARPMRHTLTVGPAGGTVRYAWREHGAWHAAGVEVRGAAAPLRPGSEAEFITEHYWGYARQRDGGTVEYRVEHPPWNVWEAEASVLECDVAAVYGEAFVPYLSGPPCSAFLADGSPVTVRRGVRL
jgi:uncharacterized protein